MLIYDFVNPLIELKDKSRRETDRADDCDDGGNNNTNVSKTSRDKMETFATWGQYPFI